MEYRYKVDCYEKMWRRSWVTIQADTQEEADEEIKTTMKTDMYLEPDWSEDLIDTASQMTVEENGGDATIEIIRDNESNETLWTNKQ